MEILPSSYGIIFTTTTKQSIKIALLKVLYRKKYWLPFYSNVMGKENFWNHRWLIKQYNIIHIHLKTAEDNQKK